MDSFGSNESKVWRPKSGTDNKKSVVDAKKNANPLKGAVNFVADEAKDIGRRVGEFTGIGKGHETKVGGDVSVDDKNKTIKAGSGGKEKNTNYYDRSDISTADKVKHGAKDAVKSSLELAGATEAVRGAASVGGSLKNAGKGTAKGAEGAAVGKAAEKAAGKEAGKRAGKRAADSIMSHEFQTRSNYMQSPGQYPNQPDKKDTSTPDITSSFDADDASSSHAEDMVNKAVDSAAGATAGAPSGVGTIKEAKTSTPSPKSGNPDLPKKTGNQFLDAYNNYQKKSRENWSDPELF